MYQLTTMINAVLGGVCVGFMWNFVVNKKMQNETVKGKSSTCPLKDSYFDNRVCFRCKQEGGVHYDVLRSELSYEYCWTTLQAVNLI